MPFFRSLLSWFAEDPIRLLTVTGGAGGVAYWVDRFRNRSRLQVRILREETGSEKPLLRFEAQNLGVSPMSLEPVIALIGYTPLKRERRIYHFALDQALDRSLPPHTPKTFEAKAPPDAEGALGFLWYRQYTFAATRGRGSRVCLRYVEGPRLSGWRFRTEFALFRWKATQHFLIQRAAPKGPMRLT